MGNTIDLGGLRAGRTELQVKRDGRIYTLACAIYNDRKAPDSLPCGITYKKGKGQEDIRRILQEIESIRSDHYQLRELFILLQKVVKLVPERPTR